MKKNIVIIILVVTLILSNGFSFYKIHEYKNLDNSCDIEENKKEEESNLPYEDIFEYLKNVELIDATLKIIMKDGKYIFYDGGEQPNPGVDKKLTKEEFLNVIDKLKNNFKRDRYEQEYYFKTSRNVYRPSAYETLLINYKYQGKEYNFELLYGANLIYDDPNITKILEKEFDKYKVYSLNSDKSLNELFGDMFNEDEYIIQK